MKEGFFMDKFVKSIIAFVEQFKTIIQQLVESFRDLNKKN